jgi:hypothetical protein
MSQSNKGLNMKQTIHFPDFLDAFHSAGRNTQFSYEGLNLLYEFLDENDPDYELDVIAICCEFSEMTELEIRDSYGLDDSESATEYLQKNGFIVGTTDKTIVFQNC